MDWYMCDHPTSAGCYVAVCGFFCILSIFSMLPEWLGHLEAVQYLVSLNPREVHCCVQLILLFYHTKSLLGKWAASAVENHPPQHCRVCYYSVCLTTSPVMSSSCSKCWRAFSWLPPAAMMPARVIVWYVCAQTRKESSDLFHDVLALPY